MVRRFRPSARVLVCAALLGVVCVQREGATRVTAQPAISPEQLASMRALYDDDRTFEQLSSALQMRLERLFGRKTSGKDAATPAPEPVGRGAAASGAFGPWDPPTLIANPLVNNPALDVSAHDTQSGTTLTLAAGSNVVVSFNNSAVFTGSNNHFTGWSTSGNGGTAWTDGGALPASSMGDVGFSSLAYHAPSANVFLSTLCFSLANCLAVFRSPNNGASWNAPVNAVGAAFTGAGNSIDKPWLAVDNYAGTGQGNSYVTFRNFGGGAGTLPNGIYVCRSTDAGATWGATCPLLSAAAASTAQGPWVTIAPDHGVYVFWYELGSIKLGRSYDRGVTFNPPVDVTTLLTTGVNGNLGLNGNFRTNAFPQAVASPTDSHLLYMIYNDTNGTGDKANIYFRYSANFGTNWSAALKLNDDATTNDQFFPTIAITPDGTHLFASWYDRRSDAGNSLIERWGAIATISGPTTVSWGPNFPISSGSFPPVVGQDSNINATYMGDYDQSVADNSFFYTTWGDNRLSNSFHTNQPDVRFAKIPVTGPGPLLTYQSSSVPTIDSAACNSFYVTLKNVGSGTATGVSAVLSTAVPGVVIEQASANYPSIPAGQVAANTTPFRVRFGAGYVCALKLPLTLTVTTSSDSFTMPFTLGMNVGLAATTASNSTPMAITDNATIESPVVISGVTSSIAKVTVSFYATHTFDADLDVFLVGPDNTTVELTTDNGSGGDNFGSACSPASSMTTFDDDAGTSITTGTAPFVGSFRPEGLLSAFANKTGAGVNGTWKLRITDDAGSDVGTLNCWSLTIVTATCTVGGSCSTETRRISDFDGDRRSDITIFRPSAGSWFSLQSNGNYSTFVSTIWGINTDIPVPGDYDGDAKTDFAVFRPSAGIWYIKKSTTNYTTFDTYNWGVSTDVPVPGDYDGDGRTDLAIYRPSSGLWFVKYSSTNYATAVSYPWGLSTDVPVPADYDGDGKIDYAVYRPSNGVWFIVYSSVGYTTFGTFVWGVSTDVTVPGDYDGDGRADIAIYRPSNGVWFIRWSSTNFTTFNTYTWGVSTDTPVPGDFDGDGRLDIAVFRPSNGTWYVLPSTSSYTAYFTITWGIAGDVPVLGRH